MDSYSRTARLYPALLTLLPFTVGIIVFFDIAAWVRTLALAVLAAGLHIAVMTKVADWGRVRQAQMWAELGGNPTALKLRWSTAEDDATQVDLHRRVAAMSGIELPSRGSEEAEPDAALRTYDRAVARLREKTRDSAKYPRVRAELIAYGFARNVYGVRRIGLLIATTVTLVAGVVGVFAYVKLVPVQPWRPLVVSVVGLFLIALWLFWFTKRSVEQASERYADALLAAADSE